MQGKASATGQSSLSSTHLQSAGTPSGKQNAVNPYHSDLAIYFLLRYLFCLMVNGVGNWSVGWKDWHYNYHVPH